MALTLTNLTAAITNSKVQNIAVASTVGAVVGGPMKIDNEYMVCTAVVPSFTISVRSRGNEGSAAVAHDVNAPVLFGVTGADFPAVPTGSWNILPPQTDDVLSIGQNQTITPPLKNTTYIITCPTACAITLLSGSPAQVGITLTFISNTAFSHVITYAAGFFAGVNTVATFPAKVGASLFTEVGVNGILAALGTGNDAADVAFTA